MDKSMRILRFFILLAVLFFNPLSCYLLFHQHPVYQSVLFHFSTCIIPGSLLFAFYKLNKSSFTKLSLNLIFSGAFSVILFSTIIFTNAFIGYRLEAKQGKNSRSLLFEPNQTVRYKTFEFDFTAHTNSIGLRNVEINLDKKDKCRIVCVGDSWTYGWGVSDEFTWPKQLEQLLKNRGITNIEIINCGQPGQYPTRYREKLEQVLPLLKPDLVLAGIHQLDDLAQLYEGEFRDGTLITGHHPLLQKNWMQKAKLFLNNLIDACFGNYLVLKNKVSVTLPLQQKWKEEVKARISKMNLAEKLNYLNLDEPLRKYYETGNLNPALLYYYLDAPNRDFIFNQPNQPASKFALELLKKEMDAMRSLCATHGSSFVFLNLPGPLFTGHTTLLPPSNTLQDYFLQNNRIDSMYKEVATVSKVDYLEMTQEFKQLNPKDAYFYKYDGHPTAKGYEVMAKFIAEFLMQHKLLKLKE